MLHQDQHRVITGPTVLLQPTTEVPAQEVQPECTGLLHLVQVTVAAHLQEVAAAVSEAVVHILVQEVVVVTVLVAQAVAPGQVLHPQGAEDN